MPEIRRQFHEELDGLHQRVLRAAAMVTEGIPRATAVLLDNDLQGAQDLIESDDDLDLMSVEIDEHVIRLMALQQPMASDLRAVVAAMKLNGEIERSGDLVVNIAKTARRIYGVSITPKCRGIIQAMSTEASLLFRLAVDAYADGDDSLASALDDMDDRLDGLTRDLVAAVIEGHQDGHVDLPVAVQLALVSRFYERIGDHAVNIGESVQFIVTGWLPEHTGAARAAARRQARADMGAPEEVAADSGEDGE